MTERASNEELQRLAADVWCDHDGQSYPENLRAKDLADAVPTLLAEIAALKRELAEVDAAIEEANLPTTDADDMSLTRAGRIVQHKYWCRDYERTIARRDSAIAELTSELTNTRSRCANCGTTPDRAEKIVSVSEGEWVCSDRCEQQHEMLGCPFEHGQFHRHPIETEQAQATIARLEQERSVDGLWCPACGQVFHDSDVTNNPNDYHICPECGAVQHQAHRGPLVERRDAILATIARLTAERDAAQAECHRLRNIDNEWRGHLNAVIAERDEARAEVRVLRTAVANCLGATCETCVYTMRDASVLLDNLPAAATAEAERVRELGEQADTLAGAAMRTLDYLCDGCQREDCGPNADIVCTTVPELRKALEPFSARAAREQG